MADNAFLDKGIILGYCFLVDPHHRRCHEYIHSGPENFIVTDEVRGIYPSKKEALIERHQTAILDHVRRLKIEYSGNLSQNDVDEIREGIDKYENPAWRYLDEFYEGKEGKSVYEVSERLRDIQQEIEQLSEQRKEVLYPLLQGWIRWETHEAVQTTLAGLREDDEEDFWICITHTTSQRISTARPSSQRRIPQTSATGATERKSWRPQHWMTS